MSLNEKPILECINLSKDAQKPFSPKKFRIINKLSFSLSKGSMNVILGHNGAGKSTLLKSIMGFNIPSEGSILFNGQTMSTQDRANIGYMPESDTLPTKLTPFESLYFQADLYNHKYSLDKVTEILDKVGLKKHQKKLNRNLSKGMGRRLAWALASHHKPALLILDEPYSGLDPIGRIDMTKWIRELHEGGTSVLICTHELDLIPDYTDHLYILNQGKIVFETPKPIPDRDVMLKFLKPFVEGA